MYDVFSPVNDFMNDFARRRPSAAMGACGIIAFDEIYHSFRAWLCAISHIYIYTQECGLQRCAACRIVFYCAACRVVYYYAACRIIYIAACRIVFYCAACRIVFYCAACRIVFYCAACRIML